MLCAALFSTDSEYMAYGCINTKEEPGIKKDEYFFARGTVFDVGTVKLKDGSHYTNPEILATYIAKDMEDETIFTGAYSFEADESFSKTENDISVGILYVTVSKEKAVFMVYVEYPCDLDAETIAVDYLQEQEGYCGWQTRDIAIQKNEGGKIGSMGTLFLYTFDCTEDMYLSVTIHDEKGGHLYGPCTFVIPAKSE